jgi:hypothetical protein
MTELTKLQTRSRATIAAAPKTMRRRRRISGLTEFLELLGMRLDIAQG